MTLNQIIDIAVVLVAVYATLSCICSWLNEKIASWLRLRGWNLFKGILALLDTQELAAHVFNHPLISSTSPDAKNVTAAGTTPAPAKIPTTPAANPFARFGEILAAKPPSYADARNFSLALWSTIANAGAQHVVAALNAVQQQANPQQANPQPNAQQANPQQPNAQQANAQQPNAQQPNAQQANAQADPTDPTGSVALAKLVIAAPEEAIMALQSAVANATLLTPSVRAQLNALLSAAGTDYTKLLAATDGWFNAQMDRVSGWYKREVAWIMAAIALVVVTVTGVDSVEVVRLLSAQTPQQLSALADSTGTSVTQTDGTVSSTFDVTKFLHPLDLIAKDANGAWTGIGNVLSNWMYVCTVDPTTKKCTPQPQANATPAPHASPPSSATTTTKTNPATGTAAPPVKYARWPGMVATYLALLLGGPFWFQALQALANVRSTGRKPKRSDQPPQ